MGSLSILLNSPLNREQQEVARIGEVCGEQLRIIIDDILDISKLEVC
jgi:hypothetical protein